MLCCEIIEDLFHKDNVFVLKDGGLVTGFISSGYSLVNGKLYHYGHPSTIERIYRYENGAFKCLYQEPIDIINIIQTGDFIKVADDTIGVLLNGTVIYEDGTHDFISDIANKDDWIIEIRRPKTNVMSFSTYHKMDIIWER